MYNTIVETIKDLNYFGALYQKIIDLELAKIVNQSQQNEIIDFLNKEYLVSKIFKFFIPAELLRVTEEVFQNEVIRDFMLEITDRFSVYLNNDELNSLVDIVSDGIYRNHYPEKVVSLMPTAVAAAIEIKDDKEIKTMLEENMWLLMLLLNLMFFQQSIHCTLVE